MMLRNVWHVFASFVQKLKKMAQIETDHFIMVSAIYTTLKFYAGAVYGLCYVFCLNHQRTVQALFEMRSDSRHY